MNKLLTALLLLVFVVACTPTPAPVPVETPENNTFLNGGYHEVAITGFTYSPKAITVYQGDRVKWINKMPFPKSIWVWGQEASPVIRPDLSWSFVFLETGLFKYRDLYAQDMEGNVTVLPYEERPDVKARLAENKIE